MLAVMLLLLSAPAPMPRAAKPAPPPVLAPCSVVMTWRGTDCATYFHADGTYSCLWGGDWWRGVWECKGGVLTVSEQHRIGEPSSRWSVRLKCPQSGAMPCGTPWRVRLLIEVPDR